MKLQMLILLLFIITGCSEPEPNFFALGKKSYSASNYALAKNQFKMIKKADSNYVASQHYLRKIDSLEKLPIHTEVLDKPKKKIEISSFRRKFAGIYKIEVDGVSSREEVEVYILQADGTAEWLWVEYIRGRRRIEDRSLGSWSANDESMSINIPGSTGTMTEVYELNNGTLRNNLITKRWLRKTDEAF